MSVETHGNFGDYDITDLDGGVDLHSDRADVRLSKIGANARVELGRSDLVRAVDLKGNLDLQGKGSDIELENIAGQVTINGTYSGSLEFKNVAKSLHFESPNTDLRVESLPGQISMDLGELTGNNLVGPVHLVTKSKDVKIENFSQSLELETERGDVELEPSRQPLAKIEVRSQSGQIDLVLPDKAGFQLMANTDHGEAVNDFGPPIQKETDGHSASLKGFAAIAVLTLALGIGANTTLFSVVNGVLLNPLPYPHSEQLVAVYGKTPGFDQGPVVYLNFLDWQRDTQTFSSMAIYRNQDYNVTGTTEAERLSGYMISAGFFSTLGVQPILGRTFRSDDDQVGAAPVVILGGGLWRRKFGSSPDVIGKSLT
jgi:hypothetical protein